MGRINKGVNCSIQGCKNAAERSLSLEQVSKSSLKVDNSTRRVYLCHEHYKKWKKETKKDRDLERSLISG
ncbi:MAG: hypothetical protein ABSB40_06795 [Nitrososphaeria archaeon]